MKQNHYNFIFGACVVLGCIILFNRNETEYINHQRVNILWHCYREGYDRLTVTNLNLAYPTINVIDTNKIK
jgi:hypothetical protein